MVVWTNKGLSSSYKRNSTRRYFRMDTETHSAIRLLYLHWAILSQSHHDAHPLPWVSMLLHGPRWQHHFCHHICNPGTKKGKCRGQKCLLAEWVSFSKKTMAFSRCFTKWLLLISHWSKWGHVATPFIYKGIWKM